VLVRDGAAHTIVRRETLEDLLRLENPLPASSVAEMI
jgi:hypothetical protein